MACGVRAGTKMPFHAAYSYPGTPLSAMVGTLGSAAERLALPTPSALRRPALICGNTAGTLLNAICIWPLITSVIACPPPLYGTCTMFTAARPFRSSMPR